MAQELISVYQINKDLIKDYEAETIPWSKALIVPGQEKPSVTLAVLSKVEVEAILTKLDMLAINRQNPAISAMLAEEADSILTAIRMVKTETKEDFRGILGSGANLDIRWLTPRDVGDSNLLNSAGTASRGLWGGTSGQVITWLHTISGSAYNASDNIIDEQKMVEEAGVIHLGAIDPIEVPKCNLATFKISGVASPAQALPFTKRSSFGTNLTPVVRFEKPIIVGPEKTQEIGIYTTADGDTKLELLSLLIAKAESLTLTA